jgi:hypothetical protein
MEPIHPPLATSINAALAHIEDRHAEMAQR